jgi:protein-S-isoprenylcysteine O-methyltransferase Ste14
MSSRSRIRTIVAAVVIVLIAGALIFETPGTAGIAGMLVVIAAMVLLIIQERRTHSQQ